MATLSRCAVVTGANKGIGLEICRQLGSNGVMVVLTAVMVVLTARDENKGLLAVENLKNSGLPNVVFHQLDLMSAHSITTLATFVKKQYGKLDILVNNAGVGGAIVDWDAFKVINKSNKQCKYEIINMMKGLTKQTYKLAEECVCTNFYGTEGVTEALLPCLLLSNSPRIVNVSASIAKLESIPSERAKMELNDIDTLTKERLDQIVNEFLKDFKDDLLEAKGWPSSCSAYIVSKAALNAYTRIVAKEHPTLCANSVCPGFVKTDINSNSGFLTVEDGAKGPVWLALLSDGGPSGLFFEGMKASTF